MNKSYGETSYFWRDIKIIKFCKECGVEFRPARYSYLSALGLCYKHRRLYFQKERRAWYKNLSPEAKAKYIKNNYKLWKAWVEKHKDKRKQQALASYHRHKLDSKNKARKHRATRVSS